MTEFNPLETMPADLAGGVKRAARSRARRANKSPMSAVWLKCMDCVCWERSEAKACKITGCALWELRKRAFSTEDRPKIENLPTGSRFTSKSGKGARAAQINGK